MPEVKDTNPKDALGIKKVPLHCIPTKPMLEVGLAMMEGGRKYGAHNYRVMGVRMSTYYDAAMRHLMAWWEGEDIDPDSGVHHLVKCMASLFVVRDAMHMGLCKDDRPVKYPGGINLDGFNKIAADIVKTYPECKKPFTQVEKIPGELQKAIDAGRQAVDSCYGCMEADSYTTEQCSECQLGQGEYNETD